MKDGYIMYPSFFRPLSTDRIPHFPSSRTKIVLKSAIFVLFPLPIQKLSPSLQCLTDGSNLLREGFGKCSILYEQGFFCAPTLTAISGPMRLIRNYY